MRAGPGEPRSRESLKILLSSSRQEIRLGASDLEDRKKHAFERY